jgi:hypothetical protein
MANLSSLVLCAGKRIHLGPAKSRKEQLLHNPGLCICVAREGMKEAASLDRARTLVGAKPAVR